MKLHTLITAALLSATSLTPTPANAREVVVGFSPNQNPDILKSQVERVIQHLLKTVEPGEKARLFDAAKADIIAIFAVPNKEVYANPRAKLQVNREALGKLKRFIDRAQAIPGREGQINPPAFLQAVRRNYTAQNGADLIILGSPIFDDPKAPSVSMAGGRVGNDGHVAAKAGESVYATNGIPGSLEGYNVYFGLIGPDWAVSDQHAYRTERFWALSVEGHGGSLNYFGDDLETLFGLAGQTRKPVKHAEQLVPMDKLEMLSFAPDTAKVSDIYTQEVEPAPAPEPLWKTARNVTIGATWDCLKCDVDLYVRPNPSAPVVFYDQANTNEGRLFKDFTNSPTTGYETVSLNGVVDLSQVRLALNFYAGKSTGPVKGEVRIAIGEKVWAAPFAIPAVQGNSGAGAETVLLKHTIPNNAWVILDPLKIVSGE